MMGPIPSERQAMLDRLVSMLEHYLRMMMDIIGEQWSNMKNNGLIFMVDSGYLR